MTFSLTFAQTFMNELIGVPQNVAKRVSKATKLLERDPISAEGDAKKLKGYENVYRIRIGDYRLFYAIGSGWVKLLSVRKRNERTYETEIPNVVAPETTLDRQSVRPKKIPSPPNPLSQNPTSYANSLPSPPSPLSQAGRGGTGIEENLAPLSPLGRGAGGEGLPFALTEEILQQWQIPSSYWRAIAKVNNAEALLEIDMPDRLLNVILDNLYPRSIQEIDTQPEFILSQAEDLDRYFAGDLSAFLLKLSDEQEKLIQFGSNGTVLIKGGAGTGKSTLALYRIKKLVEQGCTSILFTTYTNALVSYSEQLLEQLLGCPPAEKGVEVTTIDAIARRYFITTGKKTPFIDRDKCLEILAKALEQANIPAQNVFDRQVKLQTLQKLGLPYLLDEILQVIESWGIRNLDDYIAHDRRGRAVPLRQNIREAIWTVYETWDKLLAKNGSLTWEQLRRQALEVAQNLEAKPYQAIVIDEAQDFSPVALRFLLNLTPNFDNIYITADASQSIYQRGFSWKQIHEDLKVTGRTLILKQNYRNTQQIAIACTDILLGTEAGDPDCVEQIPSLHIGEPPLLFLHNDQSQELIAIRDFLVDSAKRFRLPLHGSAILCPSNYSAENYAKQLTQLGLKAKFVSGKKIDIKAPYIKVLTLYAAKGLEFPFVVVTGLEAGNFPSFNNDLPTEEYSKIRDEQRRLFYVGCSRAMRSLMVCGSSSHPSEFIENLKAPYWKVLN
jgi:superfamily I DNA/RNA helicase/mRNA-degrading endonuclease RelE of RelBE toxin-antitoxin system